jgi:hypothetical protein
MEPFLDRPVSSREELVPGAGTSVLRCELTVGPRRRIDTETVCALFRLTGVTGV